uniref:Uncharacterized protein n=1 Tax=Oryza nivara TaxID=4536 RepID=A0A0E0HQJ9_ORYNI
MAEIFTEIAIESPAWSIDIQRLAADLETKLCNVDLEGGRRRRRSPECLISKVKPQASCVAPIHDLAAGFVTF